MATFQLHRAADPGRCACARTARTARTAHTRTHARTRTPPGWASSSDGAPRIEGRMCFCWDFFLGGAVVDQPWILCLLPRVSVSACDSANGCCVLTRPWQSPLQVSRYLRGLFPAGPAPGSLSDRGQLSGRLPRREVRGSHSLRDTALSWGFRAHAGARPGALVARSQPGP